MNRLHRTINRAVPRRSACSFAIGEFWLFLFAGRMLRLSSAQRDPVLQQVDDPHAYYYREMYLPQLTTGPSAAAWTSDSRTLVYSMAGSLWRQKLDSTDRRADLLPEPATTTSLIARPMDVGLFIRLMQRCDRPLDFEPR